METIFDPLIFSYFPSLKRYFQEYFYASPKKGCFVSLTYLKNNKMISVDVEKKIRERINQQYKNTTEVSNIEQNFDKFSRKLEKRILANIQSWH